MGPIVTQPVGWGMKPQARHLVAWPAAIGGPAAW